MRSFTLLRTDGAIARSLSLAIAIFLIGAAPAPAGRPVGYGRATVGGGAGPICHVRDEASLRACVAGPNPAVVVTDVALTINPGRAPLEVGSNKTIDGAGRLSVVHDWVGFDLATTHNVVIRNVRFRGSGADLFPAKHSNCAHPTRPTDVEGCGVSISIWGPAANIWIDHDTFEACGNKCIAGWGRAQPTGVVPVPDLITISNSTFRDAYYAILFGVAARVPADQLPVQPGRVTLYGNLFERVFRRDPRVASGFRAHVFNNVIRDFGGRASCRGADFGFGPSAVSGAQMLLENNVIEAWPDPGACKQATNVDSELGAAPGERGVGQLNSRGNLFKNGATGPGDARVFAPGYPYRLLPAGQVEAEVRDHAGILAQS